MSINNAILGILSYRPLTGYDLKKIIQDSPFMYWSGNNNQIYKALVELLDEGYVTNEVFHQESSPSKKIYTITDAGRVRLKAWVLSRPEAPECKKTFLMQLAWADLLSQEELKGLLAAYENEIRVQIIMHREQQNRAGFSPDRTAREVLIWDMIHDNILSSYESELVWVQKLREKLMVNLEETNKMNYKVIEKDDKRYIEFASSEVQIRSEKDAIDIISACFENDVCLIMLHSEALDDDFFKLRTGVAGAILQKFVNYRFKVALVVSDDEKIKGKFKELLAETNKGNDYRVFNSKTDAEKWLLSLK